MAFEITHIALELYDKCRKSLCSEQDWREIESMVFRVHLSGLGRLNDLPGLLDYWPNSSQESSTGSEKWNDTLEGITTEKTW
jgi:hypothetical protein